MTSRFLAAALLGVAVPAAVHAQAGDPAGRIAAYNDGLIGIMKAKLDLAGRAGRFEPLVRAYYDMPTIAGLVVGPAWATASASDKAAAIQALTHHSAVSLARNFKSYDGTPFVIDPKVVTRGADSIVKVTINADTLYYRMRQSGGTWKIIDVVSSGVSNLALQRADIAGTLQSGGIPALVRKLAQLDAAK